MDHKNTTHMQATVVAVAVVLPPLSIRDKRTRHVRSDSLDQVQKIFEGLVFYLDHADGSEFDILGTGRDSGTGRVLLDGRGRKAEMKSRSRTFRHGGQEAGWTGWVGGWQEWIKEWTGKVGYVSSLYYSHSETLSRREAPDTFMPELIVARTQFQNG